MKIGKGKKLNTQNNSIHSLDEFDSEMSGGRQYCTVIEPAFDKNNVAVTIVSSDEYAPFAGIVIASLITNSSEQNNYDIVVLTNDMYQRNIWKLENMANCHENVSIRILDISKLIESFSFYTWAHFTSNTYYRLLTPDVFVHYEKVIYLDSDIVVNHDIAELYATDITDYYIGCAYDTHVVSYCTRKPALEQREYNEKKLGLKKPEEYFQAGVTIFNIKKIQEDFEEGYLLTQAIKHKLRWLDQDLLNMLFQGHIKRLPIKWNVMVSNLPDNLDEYFLPDDLKREYFDARKDPYIIHYVGRAIPCYTTTPDLYEYFWKYARKTVFYEILIQRICMDYSEKLKQSLVHEAQMGKIILRPHFSRYIKNLILKLFPEETMRREWLNQIFQKVSKRQ